MRIQKDVPYEMTLLTYRIFPKDNIWRTNKLALKTHGDFGWEAKQRSKHGTVVGWWI